MLTGFVIASVAAGGLPVLIAPLPFRVLLDVRYPPRTKEVYHADRIAPNSNAALYKSPFALKAARGPESNDASMIQVYPSQTTLGPASSDDSALHWMPERGARSLASTVDPQSTQ